MYQDNIINTTVPWWIIFKKSKNTTDNLNLFKMGGRNKGG